jgi:hypothetical protein
MNTVERKYIGGCRGKCGDDYVCTFCQKYNGGLSRNYYPSDTHPRVLVTESVTFYPNWEEHLWIDGEFISITEDKPAIIMGVLIESKDFKLKFSIHGKEITFEELKNSFSKE